MAETDTAPAALSREEMERRLAEAEATGRTLGPRLTTAVGVIAALWSLFQLWIASPLPYDLGFGLIVDVPARGVHLAFGLLLCFLTYPPAKRAGTDGVPWYDWVIALLASFAALYLYLGYDGLVSRQGVLLKQHLFGVTVPTEFLIGGVGIVLLLEATRRSIGWPLVIVALVFLFYSVFGQSMPEVISHRGVSLNRLIGYQWLGGEAIFGIPISVSVGFVFLFVLFGALLEKAGAGQYFLSLAFSMVGRFSGGPAKAAILASGMTGMISGSSIANVVTTGTFTIPVMRRMGMPATKAGAIEVAASTNGQIMPPIMGAAAFIIAEFIGISYFDVIIAAALPAALSYIALLYISHLEAQKLGLVGMPANETPPFWPTFKSGLHYLIPIVILIYLLMVERWTASSSVFYAIVAMFVIMLVEPAWKAARAGGAAMDGVRQGFSDIYGGLVSGARNMVSIAVAVAAAGIIVGSVSSTGLNNAMVGVVEAISGGNIYVLLVMTAVLCLILGMGLPTTANYLVVASLLAGVVVEIGSAAGLVLPLIAVHLFVFYFGLMADSTPPVCLAAFAASAISRADPLRTGVQSFLYDIRTGVLPFVFIFNPALLLVGVDSFWYGALVALMSLVAILCFSSLTQGWMLTRVRWYESVALAVVTLALFRPGFFMDKVYPPYDAIPLDRFAAGEATPEAGRKIRLHVTRETDYGDRYKLFVLDTPDPNAPRDRFAPPVRHAPYGVALERAEDGRYRISDVDFGGPAEKAGLDFSDVVTDVDVENLDQPPKELVYPVALALLGLIFFSQWARRPRRAAARTA